MFELLSTCILAAGAMVQYQPASQLSGWMTFFLAWSPVVGALNVILAVPSYRMEVVCIVRSMVGTRPKESGTRLVSAFTLFLCSSSD